MCTSAAVLASPFPHVAYLFSPKVSQSTKMSVSQPKRVVVYLCGGSGGPSRDLAFLFGPKVGQSIKMSVSQPMRAGGMGFLTADFLIYLPRSVANYICILPNTRHMPKGHGPGGSWRYIAGELYRGSYRSRGPERGGPRRQLAVYSRRALQRKL